MCHAHLTIATETGTRARTRYLLYLALLLLCLQPKEVQSLAIATSGSSGASIFDLLAADQYAAQSRRAEVERLILHPDGHCASAELLVEPDFKPSKKGAKTKTKTRASGGGFGGGNVVAEDKRWSKAKALALQQKEVLLQDGVLRINGALSQQACESLRKYVLHEVETTAALYKEACAASANPSLPNQAAGFVSEDYYGIEPGRSCRTDLLLSLTAPPVSGALGELFHAKTGKLRALYESLVTDQGIFYELASVVTSRGSDRQCIHPDVPFQPTAPLYVVFAALQDVTNVMGPTTFLRASNTQVANAAFENKGDEFDSFLQTAEPLESCMNAGDLVVFDARVLHCGKANGHAVDRALFNFSFRNPLVVGDIGYKGSMRPEYTRQGIKLEHVLEAVDRGTAEAGDSQFAQYGDGLSS